MLKAEFNNDILSISRNGKPVFDCIRGGVALKTGCG